MIETIIIKSVIFLAGICTIFGFGFLRAKNQKKLSNSKITLTMQKNLKRGKLIVGMITFLLLNAGCKNMSANNLCLWANPITITESELNSLSDTLPIY